MSLLTSALLTYLEMLVKLTAIIKKKKPTDLLLGTHMMWPRTPTADASRRATEERKR